MTFLDLPDIRLHQPEDKMLDMSPGDVQRLRCREGGLLLTPFPGASPPSTPELPASAREDMPFVAAPDVTAITIDWLIADQPAVTTFHYDTGTITHDQMHDLLSTMLTYVAAHFMGAIPDVVALVKIRARGLWSSSAPESQITPSVAVHGLDTSGALPNNATFAVKRKTGLAGRKNRGRVFWPLLAESFMNTPNEVKATAAGNFVDHLNGLLAAMEGGSPPAAEVLVNKATGDHVAVIAYDYTDQFVDSQRRRLPGHNIHR